MAQNIYSLQLLRNGSIFPNYEAAVGAITGSSVQDGVIKLARYKGESADSGNTKYSTDVVKTVFGIYAAMEGNSGWTIFDSYHEIIQNIQDQIDSLTGGAGSIAQQIQAALDQLDFSGVTGNVVTGVEQTNGKVSATGANVGNLVLTDYTEGSESGHVEASDSINAAFAKLQNQIDAANDAKDAAIKALDANITAENGSYIDHIEQVDGKISGTTKALPSLTEVHEAGKPIIAVSEDKGQLAASAGTINAEFVNVTGNTFSSTTVQGALEEIETEYKAADQALKEEILGDATTSGNTLGKLEDRIEALDADAATYTVKKVTTGLDTNVKEQYVLVETKNGTSTDKEVAIPIYKDNTLKSVKLVDQALQFTYIVDSGESVVSVDVSKFLAETEFGSGVTANSDGYVHGVVDPTSETFLTVGENGFKLAGVRAAIDAASGDVKSKLDELSGKTEALSAKTVTSIASADGSVTATKGTADDGTVSYDLSTDASKVKVSSAYTAGSNTAIATGDTVDTALAKLEAQIAAAKAAATKVQKDAAASHITLSSTTGSDGETIYTIGESDIASKSGLDAEIAARKAVDGQNGDTYAANAGTNYISAATSLNDADVKLDTALKAVADSANSAQTEIDAIETAVGLNANGTYNANTSNTYTNDATSVADAVDKLDAAVKDNADDIAELSGKSVTSVTVNGVEVVSNNAAPIVLGYTNEAANSANGMVITTNESTGAMDIKFGTLDCGEYN